MAGKKDIRHSAEGGAGPARILVYSNDAAFAKSASSTFAAVPHYQVLQHTLEEALFDLDGKSADLIVVDVGGGTALGDDRLRTVAAIARARKTSAGKGKYAYQDPDDLALVVLGSPAPSGSRPTGRAGSAPSPAAVTIAGYGATSELRNPNGAGQRQLGFDGILRTVSVPIAGADSALLVGNQGQGTGACTGDSGAPAFADGHLVGILVGVSSPRASNDYCRGTAWFANLGRWRDWIETTARDLGQPLN